MMAADKLFRPVHPPPCLLASSSFPQTCQPLAVKTRPVTFDLSTSVLSSALVTPNSSYGSPLSDNSPNMDQDSQQPIMTTRLLVSHDHSVQAFYDSLLALQFQTMDTLFDKPLPNSLAFALPPTIPRKSHSNLLVDPITNTPFSITASVSRRNSLLSEDDGSSSVESDHNPHGGKVAARKHPYKKVAKNRMRKPPNAFFLYRLEKQESVVARNPNMSTQDISRLLGRMWKNEPAEIVEDYKQRSYELRSKYKEMLK